jgi:hypothetical protein
MEMFEGILSFPQIHNLNECIDRCRYVDDARMLLAGNIEYEKCFGTSNSVILNIAHHYESKEWVVCHAMMVAQTFISSSHPGDHIKQSSIPYFGLFWCYVGVASYAIATSFVNAVPPSVEDLMAISSVPSCLYIKREYTRIQLQILAAIKWKVYFPTGECNTPNF